jgi:hypothetical protein
MFSALTFSKGALPSPDGKWDAQIHLAPVIGDESKFFYPFTTTLIELQLNREPLPLIGPNAVTWWIPRA